MAGGIEHAMTAAVVRRLLAGRRPRASQDESGRFVLDYSPVYRWLAVVAVLVSAGFLALGIAGFHDDAKGLAVVGGIFATMLAGALFLARDVFWLRIAIDDEGIHRSARGGRAVTVPWTEIERVHFSESMHWFSFISTDHPTVRVSLYRNGLVTLAEHAEGKLAPAAAAAAGPLLRAKTPDPA